MEFSEVEDMLHREGYQEVCLWHNGPDEIYPPHMHPTKTAHLVMQGSIFVRMNDEEQEFHEGDRFDIPANVLHSARMGEVGCTYVMGEQYEAV